MTPALCFHALQIFGFWFVDSRLSLFESLERYYNVEPTKMARFHGWTQAAVPGACQRALSLAGYVIYPG